MCQDGQEAGCEDYCDWTATFCGGTHGQETKKQCLAYCAGLGTEAKACHLRYAAIAGRSTVPQIPCAHREVCNAMSPEVGFENIPLGMQHDDGTHDDEDDDDDDAKQEL